MILNKAKHLINGLQNGDVKSLARALTIVENGLSQSEELLKSLKPGQTPVIGVTGPPGAGKSTLVNAIINNLSKNFKIAVLAIDPTSPFNLGSLLGDRIRMASLFNNEKVYIRSLATRGSLGGLSAKIIEMIDVLKSADFDFIFIETVGVGQSEIEIAGLADLTIVVLVPESGDEVQSIKSGLMEIADVFVVNKADRADADTFANQLSMNVGAHKPHIPVLKTIAHQHVGLDELIKILKDTTVRKNDRKPYLLAEKAWRLIQSSRMEDLSKEKLQNEIAEALNDEFNLYLFIEKFKRS